MLLRRKRSGYSWNTFGTKRRLSLDQCSLLALWNGERCFFIARWWIFIIPLIWWLKTPIKRVTVPVMSYLSAIQTIAATFRSGLNAPALLRARDVYKQAPRELLFFLSFHLSPFISILTLSIIFVKRVYPFISILTLSIIFLTKMYPLTRFIQRHSSLRQRSCSPELS